MRILSLFVIILAFLWVQSAVRHLPFTDYRIDFLWLIVLYLGFTVSLIPGGIFVLLIGLVQESLGSPLHGAHVLSYLIIYLFLRLTHGHLFVLRSTAQFVWVFLLSLACKVIEAALLYWEGYVGNALSWKHLFIIALLQGITALVLFPVLNRMIGSKSAEDYVT